MLSDIQRNDIIVRALKSFERQFNVKRNPSDMVLSIDKPNDRNLCSIFITSKSDPLKIKLNLTGMDVVTSITSFRNSQLQGYGLGYDDEVYVADLELAKREHVAFYNYLKSDKFKQEVVDDIDAIIDDDGVSIVSEEGFIIILEDEGV